MSPRISSGSGGLNVKLHRGKASSRRNETWPDYKALSDDSQSVSPARCEGRGPHLANFLYTLSIYPSLSCNDDEAHEYDQMVYESLYHQYHVYRVAGRRRHSLHLIELILSKSTAYSSSAPSLAPPVYHLIRLRIESPQVGATYLMSSQRIDHIISFSSSGCLQIQHHLNRDLIISTAEEETSEGVTTQ